MTSVSHRILRDLRKVGGGHNATLGELRSRGGREGVALPATRRCVLAR